MSSAYPRPQLVRDHWECLNGPWRFCWDDAQRFRHPDDIEGWSHTITVPFPPESKASGLGDRGFHAVAWYQREFDIAAEGGRVLLRFGAVDYRAQVWVNGSLVATHEGGHTPFMADITRALRPQGPQVVTVRAEDDPHELTKPRGKQDWQLEPHSIWYPRTTGIWQTVWLERVGRTYIDKIRWTPHVHGFALTFEARVVGDKAADLTLEVALCHGERVLARDRYGVIDGEADRTIILSDPGIDDYRNELLWSPERPTLLDAEIILRSGDTVLDRFRSYAALRSVSILRDRFMLNGRPYTLRLVLDQGYWSDTLLTAPDDDALKKDVELAKAMGFNGVRKHQKIEDPRYLYWADKLGLLVWEEMPSAYRFTRSAIRRTIREWTEAIERDYSHPCIITWVPFNESWGVPELTSVREQRHAVEALYHLTKTLDSTRPVIGNDGWESSATDIIGIHDYDANFEHLRQRYGQEAKAEQLFDRRRPGGRVLTLDGYPHRGQPIMLTEFGGVAFVQSPPEGVKQTWGYTVAKTQAEFRDLYKGLLDVVIHTPLFSGFCYTQFADTFQEANGLLNADRTPKIPIEEIRKVTSQSRTHIPGGV
ncbi:glycoside hydrolase family 2 protein [Aquabacterium sp. J223]|uniref:glycoside hydrolase family 2 protein n=1 Tax=Aquabacterium sp. J223 TaxID=2898431 RepID=UPI0021ADB6FD|nr:glycoside hydrolase family 2 TIM barrel-domain containing protein [Aquabacterium sp. J223]UUX97541.1 glycoside hydrolase family 2 [Aquabacterium sp. J223]